MFLLTRFLILVLFSSVSSSKAFAETLPEFEWSLLPCWTETDVDAFKLQIPALGKQSNLGSCGSRTGVDLLLRLLKLAKKYPTLGINLFGAKEIIFAPNTSKISAYASHSHDGRLILYSNFFSRQTPVDALFTLVHEAHHFKPNSAKHVKCTSGVLRGMPSCDEALEDNPLQGAFSFELNSIAYLLLNEKAMSDSIKDYLQAKAERMLNSRFNQISSQIGVRLEVVLVLDQAGKISYLSPIYGGLLAYPIQNQPEPFVKILPALELGDELSAIGQSGALYRINAFTHLCTPVQIFNEKHETLLISIEKLLGFTSGNTVKKAFVDKLGQAWVSQAGSTSSKKILARLGTEARQLEPFDTYEQWEVNQKSEFELTVTSPLAGGDWTFKSTQPIIQVTLHKQPYLYGVSTQLTSSASKVVSSCGLKRWIYDPWTRFLIGVNRMRVLTFTDGNQWDQTLRPCHETGIIDVSKVTWESSEKDFLRLKVEKKSGATSVFRPYFLK